MKFKTYKKHCKRTETVVEATACYMAFIFKRCFLKYLIKKKKRNCKHLFRANEMHPRNEKGFVKWRCCKCKKVFTAHCGLDILEKGECYGNWGEPNKYM